MTPTIEAKYSGLCIPCGEDIKVGEFITLHKDAGWIHEECVDTVHTALPDRDPEFFTKRRIIPVMPHGKTASDRCDRCFIVHASGQMECY